MSAYTQAQADTDMHARIRVCANAHIRARARTDTRRKLAPPWIVDTAAGQISHQYWTCSHVACTVLTFCRWRAACGTCFGVMTGMALCLRVIMPRNIMLRGVGHDGHAGSSSAIFVHVCSLRDTLVQAENKLLSADSRGSTLRM